MVQRDFKVHKEFRAYLESKGLKAIQDRKV
jgi:hypothetical protein